MLTRTQQRAGSASSRLELPDIGDPLIGVFLQHLENRLALATPECIPRWGPAPFLANEPSSVYVSQISVAATGCRPSKIRRFQ
jgi:hypothetical protein